MTKSITRKVKHHGTPGTAEYYDRRKGDVSEWAPEPVQAKVTSGGSVVVSIRVAVGELEAVRRAAVDYGMSVSELIRAAILRTIFAPPAITRVASESTRSPAAYVQGRLPPMLASTGL